MTSLQNHTEIVTQKSIEDFKHKVDLVLNIAKQQGATDAVAHINYDAGFSVDVRMGEVETVSFNEDKGMSITVYKGKQQGSASSSDLSIPALESMVDAALNIAQVSAADPCFGLPESYLMSKEYPDLDLYHPWSIEPEAAIEMAKECEKIALSYDKRITNSDGVNVSTYESRYGFKNTQGGEGYVKGTKHSISCSLLASFGETMQRDYDYTYARNPNQLKSIGAIAETAAINATERLGAQILKTGKLPIVFSNRISTGLISSFIQAISGGNLYRKNSFLLDAIDTAIMPSFIQIYEQPHLKGALGSAAFDGEGVPTQNNQIVIDGILHQYVLGCYSARKMGLKTTANSGGVHNLTVSSTHRDLKELLKLMDRGFLVTELMGQGVNILTGDYSRGAAGFYVENGEIQYPVEGVTIAGNLRQMLKHIVAVGEDRNLNNATRCGSILLEEMMVAGK